MMDTWKAVFPDHSLPALSSKKRVLSAFALGVLGSLLVFSLLASLNSSYSSPIFSWFFSLPSSSSPLSASQNSVVIGAITHDANASLAAGQPDAHAKTLPGDAPNSSGQGSSPASSDQTHILESTAKHGNGDLSQGAAITAETAHQVNASRNDPGVPNQEPKNVSAATDEAKAAGIVASREESRSSSVRAQARKELSNKCDIFDGSWVRDESMPYYPAGSCPYLDDCFNCHKNGRPDEDFLKWRWQPHGCNIPRLNATDFLKRLRGKRLVFVGDSLNRNMWESLVCILRHSVKNKNKVYEVSGRQDFKTRGYYAFRFEDYECSVDFVRSPFLVRELYFKNANGSYDEKLRLDVLDETTSAYRKADIVVFNTGHWWSHEKSSRGIDYYQERNYVYPLLNVMEAYKKALTTWARWVDKNINSKRTQIFFRGYSLTHFRGQWNSGGQCHRQSEPIFNETYLSKYPWKMRTLEDVLQQMKMPVIYLNISRLTDYRKDGHPSIYIKKYASMEEQIAAVKLQDCSHWCLPGVPDTWNELLYASLLMAGKGSWKR